MQNTAFSINKTLNLTGQLVDLTTPRVMGILNVTPDSFYDGGRYTDPGEAVRQAARMIDEGATIIDVGGYSTRPGAEDILEDEELYRVLPVIRQLLKTFPSTALSIDTFRANVARAAINEGAAMVNDISGGQFDNEMIRVVAENKVPFVLMHMRGTPKTMASMSHYENLIGDITDYFQKGVTKLQLAGINDIIIDPGFGFAKTREQNFILLNELASFRIFGRPVLVGLSRKSMIWKTLKTTPEGAGNGTSALQAIALLHGASILRSHDVRAAIEVIQLVAALKSSA